MFTVGDLIVIQDGNKIYESFLSFQNKWAVPLSPIVGSTRRATGVTVTVMATVLAKMGTEAELATEKQTGKKVVIRHYGIGWKKLPEQFVGIVTEIVKEDHSDFDVIKIREQTGGVRYCRRYILENL